MLQLFIDKHQLLDKTCLGRRQMNGAHLFLS